ncbi:MAG TPA: hypothetical protein VG942_01645 [Hyphomonadaceae bacterium]|nr:hypothetical protein [Hyphomonadaceae bacterium]
MSVSWRYMLAGASVAVIAGTSLTAIGQQSGCHTCSPTPSPPPPPPSSCCSTPKNIIVNVPGVSVAAANVNVGATSTVVASAGVSTTLSSGVVVSGGASGGASVYGGVNGGFYGNAGVSPSSINGLNVDGGYETRQVVEDQVGEENYCINRETVEIRTRPVQAMCMDDTNTPHPASRTDGETQVDRTYKGEIYRCIAGTHMQVTLGEMVEGRASFDKGESFSCAKGEALWHGPGGELSCKPQTPERNCNERSLLRKYGPGVKLVQASSKKTFCEPAKRQTVTKVVKEVKVPRPIAAGDLQLDGGVGQGY